MNQSTPFRRLAAVMSAMAAALGSNPGIAGQLMAQKMAGAYTSRGKGGKGRRMRATCLSRNYMRGARSAYMPHTGGGRAAIDRPQAMARKNAGR